MNRPLVVVGGDLTAAPGLALGAVEGDAGVGRLWELGVDDAAGVGGVGEDADVGGVGGEAAEAVAAGAGMEGGVFGWRREGESEERKEEDNLHPWFVL